MLGTEEDVEDPAPEPEPSTEPPDEEPPPEDAYGRPSGHDGSRPSGSCLDEDGNVTQDC